jgi:hypothetical protein
MLPPLKQQTGTIVDVEIPYSTKLVAQELAFGLNIGMRMMTTSGTQRLRPSELSETTNEVVGDLKDLVFTEIIAPKTLAEKPVETVTVEELEKAAADVSALRRKEARAADQDVIYEDRLELPLDIRAEEAELERRTRAQAAAAAAEGEAVLISRDELGDDLPPPLAPIAERSASPVLEGRMFELEGGGVVVSGEVGSGAAVSGEVAAATLVGRPLPAGPVLLSVDTSPGAMEAQGLGPPRPLRRRSFGGGQAYRGQAYGGQAYGGQAYGGQAYGSPDDPSYGGQGGSIGGGDTQPVKSTQQILVRKLD